MQFVSRFLCLVLAALVLTAPLRAQAIGPVGLTLALADSARDGDDFLPRRKGAGVDPKKFFDFDNPRSLALVFTIGGGLLSWATAPNAFTIIEKDATSPITIGVAMMLTSLVPTLAAAEVFGDIDDGCLGFVVTIPLLTFTYVLTAIILDAVENGFRLGNTVYPLATGLVGVGVGLLIAGAKKGGDRYADVGGAGTSWTFGAAPVPGGFQLGAARNF